jgi:magnesium transporter
MSHRRSSERRNSRALRRTHKRVGEVPGALNIDPAAPAAPVYAIAYGPDAIEETAVHDLKSLGPMLSKWPVTWINVDGLQDVRTVAALGELLGLHPLALEDVITVPQRAKVERYGDHLFVITRMASLDEQLQTEQLSLFLGRNFVLTFQEHPGDCLDPVRDRLRRNLGRIRQMPADYLCYALLDAVIDAYFPPLEQYGERLETLENNIILRPTAQAVADLHGVKRDLLTLRRAVWPQRDAINALQRETQLIGEETRLYLRDCYDHVIQIIDMLETDRELASGLLDAYLSSVSNRMNEVMKVLTIIATIFIPLSFMAGLWGMNFNHMPELSWRFGYPAALSIMAAIGLTMLAMFWRKGWIGRGRNRP